MIISGRSLKLIIKRVLPISASLFIVTSLVLAQTAPLTYSTGEYAKVEGLIIKRDDDRIWVRDSKGNTSIVNVTANTKISSPKGILKVRSTSRGTNDLLPGLKVKIEGVGNDDGNLLAHKINFSGKDLKTTQQIAAAHYGLENSPTLEKASYTTTSTDATTDATTSNSSTTSNTGSVSADRSNYSVMDTGAVSFATSSFMLSPEAKSMLDNIISKAQISDAYLIEVVGYADSSGNMARNRVLSKRRADSVVSYLNGSGQIPITRILTPVGMGQNDPVANNDSLDGRAQNRRVVVNILARKDQNQNQ